MNSKKRKSQPASAPDHPDFSEGQYGRRTHVPVESLPILGTTWLRRGASYWVRRAVILGTVLFAVACQALFAWVIFHVISSDTSKSLVFRSIALTGVGIVVLGGFVYWAWWFIQTEQRKRRGEIAYPDYASRGSTGGTFAGGAGNLARFGDSAAGGCVFAASILTAGAAPFLIIQALQREYTYEHDARLRRERWEKKHAT